MRLESQQDEKVLLSPAPPMGRDWSPRSPAVCPVPSDWLRAGQSDYLWMMESLSPAPPTASKLAGPPCPRIPNPSFPYLHHVQSSCRRVLSPLISAFLQPGFDIASPTGDILFAFALRLGHLWILRALKQCSVTLGVGHTGTITHFLPLL